MSEWKVVPVEATEEMLRAGAALLCDPDDPSDIEWQREEWAAMVAAAPEAPAPFDISNIRAQARREALEEAAKIAGDYQRNPKLLPLCNADMNSAAEIGQNEAAEIIENAIRALTKEGPK